MTPAIPRLRAYGALLGMTAIPQTSGFITVILELRHTNPFRVVK